MQNMNNKFTVCILFYDSFVDACIYTTMNKNIIERNNTMDKHIFLDYSNG